MTAAANLIVGAASEIVDAIRALAEALVGRESHPPPDEDDA